MARGGNVDVKDVVVHELAVLDGAVKGARDQRARVGKLNAMTHAVAAADPAGVDQVHARTPVGNALAEHLGVDHGVERHKRLAKQRGERGRRLGDADLGAGDLGRKARHKVIHGGIGRQARDGRQHAKGVAGQEQHDARGGAHALGPCVRNVLHRVGHARVVRDGDVVVVGLAALVEHHVFADGAKADGVKDLGLVERVQALTLGVAAALDVEDAHVGPAVLVVADQQARGVGRKRGFAGAGQAKEHGRLVRDGVHAGRAVHGQHVVLDGQQVVHDAEDRLFDLTGVAGAGDQNHAFLEVDDHGGAGVEALDGRVALVAGSGEHAKVRLTGAREFAGERAREHLLDNERLAGTLAGDEQAARVVTVGAGHAAGDEHVALVEVVDDAGLNGLVALDRKRAVDGAPGDLVVHVGRIDDKAVVGRTAGALPRLDHERAVGGHAALFAADGILDKLGRRQVNQQAGLILGGIFDQRKAKVGQYFCRGNTRHRASFKSASRGRALYSRRVRCTQSEKTFLRQPQSIPPNGQKSQVSVTRPSHWGRS